MPSQDQPATPFERFRENFREAPWELKLFLILAVLVSAYGFYMILLASYEVRIALYPYTGQATNITSTYPWAVAGSTLLIYNRDRKMWYFTVAVAVLIIALGLYSYITHSEPLGGTYVGVHRNQDLLTVVAPVFWSNGILSPRVKDFCQAPESEKRDEAT